MIRVLIADDEPLARNVLRSCCMARMISKYMGECRNGPEALEMIRSLHPDLVFLDIQMPGFSGLEVLQKLNHG